MSAVSEDELLESLTWSDQSFTLDDFVDEYTLPQVIRVERGHDGGENSATLGYGEILTLHALKETPMLAGEDRRNGHAVAIRLDCPYKVQVLPHTSECKLSKCTVQDLAFIYPKVRFLEVVSAHYGTADDAESTGVGERVEIMGIDKRQKKVKVKNTETNQAITFSSTCTAEFRPLLDWRNYSVKELKSHFSFPIRVRFLVEESDDESLGIISKVPEFNVLGEEFSEVLVITTTVGSCADLKFCYEIPKDLGVKVSVAEGLLCGDRHYQEVVANLAKGFDVTRFMNVQQLEMCKCRDDIIIKAYGYDSHKELFLNIKQGSQKAKKLEDAPVLPPRQPTALRHTVSSPLAPPEIPHKNPMRKAKSIDHDGNSRPVVSPRTKNRVRNRSASNPNEIEQDNVHPQPPPVKQRPFDDFCVPIYTVSPVIPRRSPAPAPKVLHQSPPDIPTAECQPEGEKPPPVSQCSTAQHNSATIIPPKVLPLPPPRVPTKSTILPDYTEPFSHIPEHPSSNPERPPSNPEHPSSNPEQPPLSPPCKPSWRPPKGAQMVFPRKLPPNPPLIPQIPTDRDGTAKLEQSSLIPIRTNTETDGNKSLEIESGERISTEEMTENTGDQMTEDDNYEELEPRRNQKITNQPMNIVTMPTTSSNAAANSNNGYTFVTGGSVATGWETEDPYAQVARIPQDISVLTVSEVSKLLKNLNMECCVSIFEKEMVDGNLLMSLGEEELQSLELSSLHRKKLKKFINGWRPKV